MPDSALSAVVGGSIAVIGLIVAKEGKTSEFRQQWIDGLRNDVATMLSSGLHGSKESIKAANECRARIDLRLNPTEDESKALAKSIGDFIDFLNDPARADDAERAATQVINNSQMILKSEWSRVKRGEWKYVTVLSVACTFLLASGATLLWPIVKAFWHDLRS